MVIKNEILEKIQKEPLLFADILKLSNLGSRQLMPDTLRQRLRRKSEAVKASIVIADYFREKGYSDSEIFEQETEVK